MTDRNTTSEPRPTVMVVDDDADTLKLISITIQRAGYEVYRASSGPEALEQLDRISPDTIVLDLMMPGMSGMEVMTLIKAKFPWPPPVIMFTAKGLIEDRIEGMEAGAFKYLVKPVPKDVLLETVEEAVADKRGRPRLTGRW
jgi:DNA-binding response OmpR family regulator